MGPKLSDVTLSETLVIIFDIDQTFRELFNSGSSFIYDDPFMRVYWTMFK